MSLLRAVIFCRREGPRLRPFSFSAPKHLLPIEKDLGYSKNAPYHEIPEGYDVRGQDAERPGQLALAETRR